MKDVVSFGGSSPLDDFNQKLEKIKSGIRADNEFAGTSVSMLEDGTQFYNRTRTIPMLEETDWWMLKYCEGDNQYEVKAKIERLQIRYYTDPVLVKALLDLPDEDALLLRDCSAEDVRTVVEVGKPDWLTKDLISVFVKAVEKCKKDQLPMWILNDKDFALWCAETGHEYALVPWYLLAPDRATCRDSRMWNSFGEQFRTVRFALGETAKDFDADVVYANLGEFRAVVQQFRDVRQPLGQWFPDFVMGDNVFVVVLDYSTPMNLIWGRTI